MVGSDDSVKPNSVTATLSTAALNTNGGRFEVLVAWGAMSITTSAVGLAVNTT